MITVEKITQGELTLSFNYYQDYINRVKSIGARFNPDNKVWEISKESIYDLERVFEGELFYKTPRWELLNESPPDYSKLYKFDTPVNINSLGFKLKPFKYQEFGIKFLIDRLMKNGMGFICDDVGLGKTVQAIGAFKYMFDNDLVKDLVIVCKKSLKSQWAEEIKKFVDIDSDIYIIDKEKKKRFETYNTINSNPNKTITIVNYHVLLKDSKELKPDMVIYDEVHEAKKYNGKINKACKVLTSNCKYCLFMTGTPIMSKPKDLYGIISIKEKKYFGGSYKKFEDRYLVIDRNGSYEKMIGYKNLNELRDKVQSLILRRTANEVDIDLPEIIEITKNVPVDSIQEEAISFVHSKLIDIENKIKKNKSIYNLNKDKEVLEKINELEGSLKGIYAIEQIIANSPRLLNYSKSNSIRYAYKKYTPDSNYLSSKYICLLNIVEEVCAAGQKVIIFSKYETVVKHLCDFLLGYKIKSVPYFGAMNQDQRDESVRTFKYDNTVTAFIATDAGAEGLNLQVANTVIHFDLPYNHAIKTQRDGRARRAGSTHSRVVSYSLLTEETRDEQIYKKIKESKRDFDIFVSANNEQSKVLKSLSN